MFHFVLLGRAKRGDWTQAGRIIVPTRLRLRHLVGVLLLTVAMSVVLGSAAHAARQGGSRQQGELHTVKSLISAVNRHQFSSTIRRFAPSAVLHIAGHTSKGSRAVTAWWRAQFVHGVHLTLRSQVQFSGGDALAVLQRKTRGGDCPKGCMEQAVWQFFGTRIVRMTLQPLATPPPPVGQPTVPPPPSAPPLPRTTPTIPT